MLFKNENRSIPNNFAVDKLRFTKKNNGTAATERTLRVRVVFPREGLKNKKKCRISLCKDNKSLRLSVFKYVPGCQEKCDLEGVILEIKDFPRPVIIYNKYYYNRRAQRSISRFINWFRKK